jgi:hypothetical protein
VKSPPVEEEADVSPALIEKPPPSPELPEPSVALIDPPAPTFAFPVVSERIPELPLDVVPVFASTYPLTPEVPAFGLYRLTLPLDVAEPAPVERRISPPLKPSPRPERRVSSPPLPEELDDPSPEVKSMPPPAIFAAFISPAVTVMSPALPELLLPMDHVASPPLPLDALAPVLSLMWPEEPEDPLPVENATEPLTPLAPDSRECSFILPLDVAEP